MNQAIHPALAWRGWAGTTARWVFEDNFQLGGLLPADMHHCDGDAVEARCKGVVEDAAAVSVDVEEEAAAPLKSMNSISQGSRA